jgi:hypothetical protein
MAKQKSVYQIQSGDWVKYKKKEAVVIGEMPGANGEKFIIELVEPIGTYAELIVNAREIRLITE